MAGTRAAGTLSKAMLERGAVLLQKQLAELSPQITKIREQCAHDLQLELMNLKAKGSESLEGMRSLHGDLARLSQNPSAALRENASKQIQAVRKTMSEMTYEEVQKLMAKEFRSFVWKKEVGESLGEYGRKKSIALAEKAINKSGEPLAMAVLAIAKGEASVGAVATSMAKSYLKFSLKLVALKEVNDRLTKAAGVEVKIPTNPMDVFTLLTDSLQELAASSMEKLPTQVQAPVAQRLIMLFDKCSEGTLNQQQFKEQAGALIAQACGKANEELGKKFLDMYLDLLEAVVNKMTCEPVLNAFTGAMQERVIRSMLLTEEDTHSNLVKSGNEAMFGHQTAGMLSQMKSLKKNTSQSLGELAKKGDAPATPQPSSEEAKPAAPSPSIKPGKSGGTN